MTKTQEAYKRYSEQSAKLHAQLEAVARVEFPVGARVAWNHCGNQQLGRITGYRWGTRAIIRNERTQREVDKDATELLPVVGLNEEVNPPSETELSDAFPPNS